MKKILPPALFLIFCLGMALVCWATGSPHLVNYPWSVTGLALLIIGLGIAFYHSAIFKREDANIMTFGEPTKLVTSGLFKYTRNPMYIGFVVALLGVALLYQAALSSLLFVALFWLIADRWYIRFEETAMEEKFGIAYREYCKNTPRWVSIA